MEWDRGSKNVQRCGKTVGCAGWGENRKSGRLFKGLWSPMTT